MKLLKFLFTGRMHFILFVLLAFVATVLYLGLVNRHQAPTVIYQGNTARPR